MSGLVFGGAGVTYHCKREAETGLEAVVVNFGVTEGNVTAAALLVQSCIQARKNVCPGGCEMRELAGMNEEQMLSMLRLSEI